MRYSTLFAAVDGLRNLGEIKKDSVALKARRVIRKVEEEITVFRDRFEQKATEAGLAKEDERGRQALFSVLAGQLEVPEGFDLGTPIHWSEIPEDSLGANHITILEDLGILVGVPE